MQMKKIIITTLICCSALFAGAKQPEKGYRGFADVDYALYRHNAPGFGQQHANHLGVSTTHGYQIRPQLFVGAGLAIDHNIYNDSWYVPVFASVRTDLQFGRFSPYADMRLGWTLSSDGGFMWEPTVGYRFNWGRSFAINAGIGFHLQCIHYSYYDYVNYDWTTGSYDIGTPHTAHDVEVGLALRVGIEF